MFIPLAEYRPIGHFDLVFCNGVFHHISPGNRVAAIETVYSSLRPGGLFAFWENNPWNPGARYVMRRIPFDQDAVTLSPPAARRLLREHGFEVMRTDFLFFFPRPLSWLRCLEPHLASLPLGAQYEILCRKI
jgi:SAM-dependent methyltransferase